MLILGSNLLRLTVAVPSSGRVDMNAHQCLTPSEEQAAIILATYRDVQKRVFFADLKWGAAEPFEKLRMSPRFHART